jgi:hypothetical protein
MYRKFPALVGEKFARVPDNFRMLAGDPTRDHFNSSDSSYKAVQFQCIGGDVESESN